MVATVCSDKTTGQEWPRYSHWDEAEQLKEIAVEIRELRAEFGQPSQVDEFLRLCSLRGSNVPGEPKLAKVFLDEILKDTSTNQSP